MDLVPDEQVEALKGELEEAHRAALAAEHRADTEAASAERQRAAAQELTAELERVQVRYPRATHHCTWVIYHHCGHRLQGRAAICTRSVIFAFNGFLGTTAGCRTKWHLVRQSCDRMAVALPARLATGNAHPR